MAGAAPHKHSEAFYGGREEKEAFAHRNYPGDGEGIPAKYTWSLLTL